MPAFVYPARAMALRRTAGDLGALRIGNGGRGRFLEQLLMAALDAAFALAQNFDVAVLVGQDLEFDVAGSADVLFQIDIGRTEGAARLVLRLQEQRGQLARGR